MPPADNQIELTPAELAVLDRLDRVMGTGGLAPSRDRANERRTMAATTGLGATAGIASNSRSLMASVANMPGLLPTELRPLTLRSGNYPNLSTTKPGTEKGKSVTKMTPIGKAFDTALNNPTTGTGVAGHVDALSSVVRDYVSKNLGNGVPGGSNAFSLLDQANPVADRQKLLQAILTNKVDPALMGTGPTGARLRDVISGIGMDKHVTAPSAESTRFGVAGPMGAPQQQFAKAYARKLLGGNPIFSALREAPNLGTASGSILRSSFHPRTLGRGLIGAGLGLGAGAALNFAANSRPAAWLGRQFGSVVPGAGSNNSGRINMDEVRRALGV